MSPDETLIFTYDFYYLWSAGKIAAMGGDPYDIVNLKSQLALLGWPASENAQTITHIPIIFWIYILLSYIPFEISRVLWFGFIAFLFLCTISAQINFINSFSVNKKLPKHLYFFLALVFPFFLGNLAYGQVNIISFLGLIFGLKYASKDSAHRSGAFLSLTIIKPHLLIPLYVSYFIYFLRERKFSFHVYFLAGVLIQALLSWLLAPEIFNFYIKHFSSLMIETSSLFCASIAQNLSIYFDSIWIRPILLIFASIVSAIYTFPNKNLQFLSVYFLLPLSLCVAPYVWSHSFILLFPTYICLCSSVFSRIGDKVKYVFSLFGVIAFSVVFRSEFEKYQSIFPLALLVYGLIVLLNNNRSNA